jgi:hypothetical protein
MANKNIPEVGEIFDGYVPAKVEIAHVTFGADSDVADVPVGDLGAYTLFAVTEPIMVLGAWTMVETAFTASVTSAFGDSGTADLFHATGTIADTTAGSVLVASTGLSVPKVYSAGQDLLLTIAGATAAAGLGHVYLQYAILED